MLYSSFTYPIFLLGAFFLYWLAPASYRKYVLAAGSVAWLTFLNWRSTAPFLLLSVFVYGCGRLLSRPNLDRRTRTGVLLAGIALPVVQLATFK